MTATKNDWHAVTRSDPCPICGKPDNCKIASDGVAVLCGRVDDGPYRDPDRYTNAGGQYLHRIPDWRSLPPVEREKLPGVKLSRRPVKKAVEQDRDWTGLHDQFHAAAVRDESNLGYLGYRLGVSTESLVAIGAGWIDATDEWTFGERDAAGEIIGIATRDIRGDKGFFLDGNRGLTFAPDWDTGHGPIVLVEGPSDTAAAIDIGLSVIGRPSNRGGVAFLGELLADIPAGREIIVIGERDEKPDGEWPGRKGAITTARELAKRLDRRIGWSFPPGNAKDTRGWVGEYDYSLPAPHLAGEFLAGLDIAYAEPAIVIDVAEPALPIVTLNEQREDMFAARKNLLDYCGFAVDTSPTGLGKNFADIRLIESEKISALIGVPTHDNAAELVAELRAEGVNAVAMPGRTTSGKNKNCEEPRADEAQAMGLQPSEAVCHSFCKYKYDCQKYGYLHQLQIAKEADVIVATHQRIAHAGFETIQDGKPYVAIHEDYIDIIRPKASIRSLHLGQLGRIVESIIYDIDFLPKVYGSGMRIKFGEGTHEVPDGDAAEEYKHHFGFLQALHDVILDLISQINQADDCEMIVPTRTCNPPKRVQAKLFKATRLLEIKFPEGEQPWSFIFQWMRGEVKSAMILVDNVGTQKYKTIVGFRENNPAAGQGPVLFADATADIEVLSEMLNGPVKDITPGGEVERQKQAVQIPRDINLKTDKRHAGSLVAGVIAERPDLPRVGLITHRQVIESDEFRAGLGEYAERIVKQTYYGSGEDRGSNEWHRECDLLIVAGTPRVPPSAVRYRLLQIGRSEHAAIKDPEWRSLKWRVIDTDGNAAEIQGSGYGNEAWRRAHRQLVRAKLVQAIGRGRTLSESGCEVVVISNEECGLSVRVSNPMSESDRAVLSILRRLGAAGDAVVTKAIANEAGLTTRRTQILLNEMVESGRAERVGRRSGWKPS